MIRKLILLAVLSILALPLAAQTAGSYTITIAPEPITLTPASGPLASGMVKSPYSATITISGGTAPYTVAVSSGALPAGLSAAISGSTLTISGTPTTAGTATFTLTVSSSGGAGAATKVNFKTNIQPR